MANEAVMLYEFMPAVTFTAATGDTWDKGCLLKLADPMTVAATSGDNDLFIGIAATDKVSGETRTGVVLMGIAKFKDSGAGVTVGTDVVIAGANTVKTYSTLDDEKGYVVGKALETAAASDTFFVLFGLR